VVERAVSELKGQITGYEVWHIRENVIVNHYEVEPPARIEYTIELHDYSALSPELVNDLDEYRASLATAFSRCARYGSDLLSVLESVADIGNKIIDALVLIESEMTVLIGAAAGAGDNELWSCQQRHNRLRSEIVQLNAALAYTISQWFTGCFPLKNFDCQIRNHSLLGVGNAYRGILSVLYFAETHFSTVGVERIIRSGGFKNAEGFDIFEEAPRTIAWEDSGVDSDFDIGPGRPRHLLALFSGRRGFRESPHSISVPLEVLFCGCSAAWSLMTFTHEIIHAHVRGILAAIFGNEDDEAVARVRSGLQAPQSMTKRDFDGLLQTYRQLVQGRIKQPRRKKCLQIAFLHYCTLVYGMRPSPNGVGPLTDQAVRVPQSAEALQIFKDEHRMINEIIVHVLDFQYFYDRDEILYIDLLWISWSIVPGVLEKLDEYILRTLCAIASNITDSETNKRFDEAVATLRERLKYHCDRKRSPALAEAHARLCDDSWKEQLRIKFNRSDYIVDIARIILHSTKIHGTLMRDWRDAGGTYDLEPLAFEARNIANPVAFLRAQLKQSLLSPVQADEQARITAWVLAACASSLHPREE